MTLRHLFRSKSITTLINRLGHCESYTYSIELETALANSIVESASLVSNSDVIKRQPDGAVLHSDWDNFDQLVSDVYGAGSIHTAIHARSRFLFGSRSTLLTTTYTRVLWRCRGTEQSTQESCADFDMPTPEQPTQESNPNTQPTKKTAVI